MSGHMFRVEFAALLGQMYSSSGTDVQGQLFSVPLAPGDEALWNNCLSWGVKSDQHTKQWKSNHASQGFYLWIRLCMLNMQKSKNKYDWGKVPRMEAKYLAFPPRSCSFRKSILNLRHMNHEHRGQWTLDIWNISAQQAAWVCTFELDPIRSPRATKRAQWTPVEPRNLRGFHTLDTSARTGSKTFVKFKK